MYVRLESINSSSMEPKTESLPFAYCKLVSLPMAVEKASQGEMR